MFKKNTNIPLIIILISITLAVFLLNFYNEILKNYIENPYFFKIFFSDFFLIYKGSEILNQGVNPYEEWLKLHQVPFFNPPIVFNFFKFISNFEYVFVLKFWLFFLFLSFFLIPLIFFRIFKIKSKFFFIFLICFGGISVSVLLTGNLSVILGCFFATSLYFLSKNKYQHFFIILSILSLIKFPYLIFFGIPFLTEGIKKEIFIKTFLYLFIVTLIYFSSYYFNNELFTSWLMSLKFSKYIGDDGDFGRGLFRILNDYFFSSNYLTYVSYFTITGIVFIFLILLYKKTPILKKKDWAIAFSVITLSMLLPRLKSYDVLITIPSLFFIIENINFKVREFSNLFIKFTLFLMLFCWTSPYAPISLYLTIFLIFALNLKFNFIEKK